MKKEVILILLFIFFSILILISMLGLDRQILNQYQAGSSIIISIIALIKLSSDISGLKEK